MQASMVDGCPDVWSGPAGIPVCVLGPGSSQHENNNVKSPRDGELMKERDYIGIGLPANLEQAPNAPAPSVGDKMECGNDVELSLGLCLPEKAAQRDLAPCLEQFISSGGVRAEYDEALLKSKLANSAGAKTQHFWHHSFRMNLSNDHHQQHAVTQALQVSNGASLLKNYPSTEPSWGIVPGLFAVPVPKVSTVPAKRSYSEAGGEVRRPLPVGANHVPANETTVLCAMPAPKGAYLRSAEGAAFGGVLEQLGHGSSEQGSNHVVAGGGASSAPFSHLRQLGVASPPLLSPHFRVPPQACAGGAPLPLMGNSFKSPNAVKSSPAVEGAAKSEVEIDNSRNKAPMVGWPPVRSFRKNTLQATQNNRTSSEDLQMKRAGGISSVGVDGQEPGANNTKHAFFVKVRLDGVRICRKVDLKAYGSYDELKSALQDMFQAFVSDNTKLDLLHGTNYVVTHEDKDGDCLLVGDVPWLMFVESSVKSLRIMKAMDAIGIGDKVSAKSKAQGNGTDNL